VIPISPKRQRPGLFLLSSLSFSQSHGIMQSAINSFYLLVYAWTRSPASVKASKILSPLIAFSSNLSTCDFAVACKPPPFVRHAGRALESHTMIALFPSLLNPPDIVSWFCCSDWSFLSFHGASTLTKFLHVLFEHLYVLIKTPWVDQPRFFAYPPPLFLDCDLFSPDF